MKIAFFGSSLVSAYWNGAATYYRGIIRQLHQRGHTITFYEPNAYDRHEHRDIPDPPYARIAVYQPEQEAVDRALDEARSADLIVKCSGVGLHDEYLEAVVPQVAGADQITVFWDVDAPATLDRMAEDANDPFRKHVARYDMVLTYGGGTPVVEKYKSFGAQACIPIYNAFDPDTHHPVARHEDFLVDLAFMGNRLPDREARVWEFFLNPASKLPDKTFLLGGNGWNQEELPENVRVMGHVYTRDHNAFNCSPMAVLNISRASMARYGFSPATRVFEAAGVGACMITDAWKGVEQFFEPGVECLVAATGDEVAAHLAELTPVRAAEIGAAARQRALHEHTYGHRAELLEEVLCGAAKS